jgi:microcystin-dependent protein
MPKAYSNNTTQIGTIIMHMGDTSTIPPGYLVCDGSAISRAAYQNLFNVLSAIWGAGDGSTTFNIPDCRGFFPRGQSLGSGSDPDAGTRSGPNSSGDSMGTYQSYTYQTHNHGDYGHSHPFSAAYNQGSQGPYAPAGTGSSIVGNAGLGTGTGYANIAYNGGNETRPKNFYALFLIKY